MFDSSPARCPGATIVTGNENMFGLGFSNARGDDSDPDLGHELDRDTRARVGALEIVDELFEVL